MQGRGNDAPVAEHDQQEAAGETGRDAAQEEHLERRKVARDHLHEAVADDERAGPGEHGGDAGEVGGSAHEGATWHKNGKFKRASHRWLTRPGRHCEERSDEAIQGTRAPYVAWIASLTLAMTVQDS